MSSDTDHEPMEDGASGAIPRLTKKAWALVIVGLILLTGVAAWFGFDQADQDARWNTVGFEVISPTEMDITFDVYLYTDEVVECQVRAMNVSFAEVGVTIIEVDPADGVEQRITTPITTVEEATTAEVNYCHVPG
ncbi:DUF4307 domain-containing protein [Demequina sediminicola]|uniref:DUF4307 domain-containing protein n=1 Tax=Demequina sediminicola TaxID=1095026 RepID=UPI00137937A6|nr:DUF4307 domain-containing protein [Demequina sediminicola]